MARSTLYAAAVVGVVAGIAALLAGEFFHGVEFLVTVGGVVTLLAVGVLTAGVSREEAPESAGH